MLRTVPLLLSCALAVAAEAAAPSIPQTHLAEITAANQARAALAHEAAAWQAESERLRGLIAAVTQEHERLAAEADRLSANNAELRDRLAVAGEAADLDAVRGELDAAATAIRDHLSALAARSLPGAVVVPASGGDRPFDEAMRALDATERAAASVAVEVVTGKRDGAEIAVRLLRLAGAAAWWVALDDGSAGTASMTADGLRLDIVSDPAAQAAIRRAVHIADGRQAAEAVLLPLAGGTP